MALSPQVGDEESIAVFPDNSKRSGDKRASEGSSDDEDLLGSKKERKIDSGPGAATGMLLSLRESLQNYKDKLAICQAELEEAQLEIQKWYSAFQNGSASPIGTKPDPELAVIYLQNLDSSVESLKEKLEQTKKREAAITFAYAQREKEIVELKIAAQELRRRLRPPSIQTRRLLLDPAIHAEFTRLKNLVDEKEKKVKELEEHVTAINFSTNSKMGNMLMAKCTTLQEENEEIGEIALEGKVKWENGKKFEDKFVETLVKYGYKGAYKSKEWLKQPLFIQSFAPTYLINISDMIDSPKVLPIDNFDIPT